MRRYYLHTRRSIYYVEFVVPETGQKLTARSTGTKDRDEAIMKVSEWLKDGLPGKNEKVTRSFEDTADLETIMRSVRKASLSPDDAMQIVSVLRERGLISFPVIKYSAEKTGIVEFLKLFWDHDKSPYVRERKAYGHSVSKRYCLNSEKHVRKHWMPFFGDKLLGDVTRDDLKRFAVYVSEKGLSHNSINMIVEIGKIPLRWAFREGKIPSDPGAEIGGFAKKIKTRGVLTPTEAEALFASEWPDERVYLGSLLSCVTGMRVGEVQALRLEDIREKTINIAHSWSNIDLLKKTKNEEEREIPIFPEIRDRLLSLAGKNPYGEDGFIFFGPDKASPISNTTMLRGFKAACASVSNNPPGWFTDQNNVEGDGYLWEVAGKKDKKGTC
jgi:integrase